MEKIKNYKKEIVLSATLLGLLAFSLISGANLVAKNEKAYQHCLTQGGAKATEAVVSGLFSSNPEVTYTNVCLTPTPMSTNKR